MELQRLEQMARNRERLMALNLPSLAAELMPPPPKQSAATKHKGGWVGGCFAQYPRPGSSRGWREPTGLSLPNAASSWLELLR
jgi:hypothetical protein